MAIYCFIPSPPEKCVQFCAFLSRRRRPPQHGALLAVSYYTPSDADCQDGFPVRASARPLFANSALPKRPPPTENRERSTQNRRIFYGTIRQENNPVKGQPSAKTLPKGKNKKRSRKRHKRCRTSKKSGLRKIRRPLFENFDYLFMPSCTATATATVAPTMGLLPMPMRPIISTCAGTEEDPANCASECILPIVSVMP